MTSIKTISKQLLRKSMVYILLLANIAAYIATDNFFANRTLTSAESEEKKDLVSNLYTGWKVIDWSFSLVDYFRNVGESKK